MTITLSSKNGIKQYSLPDSIKKIILFFVLFIALVIGGLSYYVKTLTQEVRVLEEKTGEIEKPLQAKLHLQELQKVEKLAREKKRQERIAQAKKEQAEREREAAQAGVVQVSRIETGTEDSRMRVIRLFDGLKVVSVSTYGSGLVPSNT